MAVTKLVLVRHGESQWNKENKFTGWTDIELSNTGREEAKQAGKLLKSSGFIFNYAYTSVLKRAIHTLWHILEQIDQSWLPVEKNWRLNERHYGALQGIDKSKAITKYGVDQVKLWRRSFNMIPPKINPDDSRFPGCDNRYAHLIFSELPVTESLAQTMERLIPYWNNVIKPRIAKGEKVLIVAHGNSLRGLLKYLDNISDHQIMDFNIPTAVPLIYEFDRNINPIKHYYLGDQEKIAVKIAEVANPVKIK